MTPKLLCWLNEEFNNEQTFTKVCLFHEFSKSSENILSWVIFKMQVTEEKEHGLRFPIKSGQPGTLF